MLEQVALLACVNGKCWSKMRSSITMRAHLCLLEEVGFLRCRVVLSCVLPAIADLNTHNSGVVRLLKTHIGNDPYRFKELGKYECEWWAEHVFPKSPFHDPFDFRRDVTARKVIKICRC